MIPIYRRTDAEGNHEKNQETFDNVAGILRKRGNVLIFSEGLCVIEKRLRPIKKGTARMAFHACEKYGFDMDLNIVPVGINYTHALQTRTEMYINFGEPIRMKDYEGLYRENSVKAILEVTERIESRLKKEVIHVNHGNEDLAEHLFAMKRNERPQRTIGTSTMGYEYYAEEKEIADKVNELEQTDPAKHKAFSQKVKDYFELCKEHTVFDFALSPKHSIPFWKYLFVVLLMPLILIGFILNYWVFRIARHYSTRIIKSNVFHASLRMGITMVTYWLYFTLILIMGSIIFTFPMAVAFIVFQIFCGAVGLYALEVYTDIQKNIGGDRLRRTDRDLWEDLHKRRAQILMEYDQL